MEEVQVCLWIVGTGCCCGNSVLFGDTSFKSSASGCLEHGRQRFPVAYRNLCADVKEWDILAWEVFYQIKQLFPAQGKALVPRGRGGSSDYCYMRTGSLKQDWSDVIWSVAERDDLGIVLGLETKDGTVRQFRVAEADNFSLIFAWLNAKPPALCWFAVLNLLFHSLG